MAAPGVLTGGIQETLYVKLNDSITDPTTLAKWKEGVGASANLVKNAEVPGPYTESANTTEFTPIGTSTVTTLSAPSGLTDFTFSFAIVETDTLHASLIGTTNGKGIEVGILKKVSSAEAAYYFKGTVAGKELSYETPNTCTITISLSAAVKRFV